MTEALENGQRTRSADMKVGTKLRRGRNGGMVVLGRRKDPNAHDGVIPWSPGWWIDGGGGLADDVIDDPAYGWEVVGPRDLVNVADLSQVVDMLNAANAEIQRLRALAERLTYALGSSLSEVENADAGRSALQHEAALYLWGPR